MSIAIIDQSPELFWFVSNSLVQYDLPLKHFKNIQSGEENILRELPSIVIMNGDDPSLNTIQFINRMRNHVFARNVLFIVFTSDTGTEYKKDLLVAGAAQVFYRGRGFNPSTRFFSSFIRWLLNTKTPDNELFEYKPVAFKYEGEFTTFGRIGWISSDEMLIETSIDLKIGDTINFNHPLFEELDIKDYKLQILDKNKIGRYYQYANSFRCKIMSKKPDIDAKKISAWIKDNQVLEKTKLVKVVYFESDPDYRQEIKQMIKLESSYCARGYKDLTNFISDLEYQKPQLILVNRSLIQKDKAKFDPIKNYLKKNFCYCITYAHDELLDINEFKKNYEYIMHTQEPIELKLLESMIAKLNDKLPEELKDDDKKLFINKYSPYSRINLIGPCELTDLGVNGVSASMPFLLSNYCPCHISSHAFILAKLPRGHFFRSFSSKGTPNGQFPFSHRLISIGQNIKENEAIKEAIDLITEKGLDEFLGKKS